MGFIEISHKGEFSKTLKHLKKISDVQFDEKLNSFGAMGVDALRVATPRRTGKTAESWDYILTKSGSKIELEWTNSNVNKGLSIAALIQYGHGVRGGGYVPPFDYINPAMKPVFDKITDGLWSEVTSDE